MIEQLPAHLHMTWVAVNLASFMWQAVKESLIDSWNFTCENIGSFIFINKLYSSVVNFPLFPSVTNIICELAQEVMGTNCTGFAKELKSYTLNEVKELFFVGWLFTQAWVGSSFWVQVKKAVILMLFSWSTFLQQVIWKMIGH